jgi:hypothetical protein
LRLTGGKKVIVPDIGEIRATIEAIISQVLAERVGELSTEVMRRAMAELGPLLAQKGASDQHGTNASALLNAAVSNIQASSTQAEVLSALLDGAEKFAGRAVLFVVRADSATSWQGRGFADPNALKAIKLDVNKGAVGRLMQQRLSQTVPAADFSSDLVKKAGAPGGGQAHVLPLVVREKVPALLYTDAGAQGNRQVDASALELLVRWTGLWLEAVSGQRPAGSAGTEPRAHSAAEPMVAPGERVAERVVPVAGSRPVATAERPGDSMLANVPAPSNNASGRAAVHGSPADQELHSKARRFARLLVEEIKLYNQAKVTEGRRHRDLYTRLRDDIDKSRATYDKRYGGAVGGSEYFIEEVINNLAEGDASLLGSGFRR